MSQPTCPKCQTCVAAGSRFCHTCGSKVTTSIPARKPVMALHLRTGAWMGGAVLILLVVSLAVFGLTGIKNASQSTAAETRPHLQVNLSSNAGPVPIWLTNADLSILMEYDWAAIHHEELQYIPCYCGCDGSSGHVSNSSCYFDRGSGGRIVGYDMHSYG